MGKVMVYTFRTYKDADQLKRIFEVDVVVLGELKKDIENLCNRLLVEKPEYILGVAKSNRKSVMETIAVNNIHGHKINQKGLDRYELVVPSPGVFEPVNRTTNTFCNYSMYKIAEYIKQNRLETKLMFAHLNSKDLKKMREFKIDFMVG
jgi:hypothetical protein